MVREGWRGTNLAAYETDFYHNLVQATPTFRMHLGEGEAFLAGIDAACAKRNMTTQLCAGNPHSFLTSLDFPTITNARASIDYDWDGLPGNPKNTGPRSVQGAHNWASSDNSYVFWATRVAPSKDNFWTSYRDLTSLGYGADSGRNGMDAELHALGALLSTGPVGIGDYIGMLNATLVRRLARADGILLRPDRPLAPMDAMWASLMMDEGSSHAMPNLCTKAQEAQGAKALCGARLWQTHATVAREDATRAPELATAPTRTLVSHAGVDATRVSTIVAALEQMPDLLLQHIIVSVDQNASFAVRRLDVYPAIGRQQLVLVRDASDGGTNAPCVKGSDALASGCVAIADPTSGTLFNAASKAQACSQGGVFGRERSGACMHTVKTWQIFVAASDATSVFLGDVSVYVSLSGYRFRLTPGGDSTKIAVVGHPDESVTLSWAVLGADKKTWTVATRDVIIGPTGREVVPFTPL
tara:strand:+ start:442 stop:1851 length:1410 start_codon:yes stop_codon:yes gene_type:complete